MTNWAMLTMLAWLTAGAAAGRMAAPERNGSAGNFVAGRGQAGSAASPQSETQAHQGDAAAPQSGAPAKHSITITFDYDFTHTPACAGQATSKCVSSFLVYDISGGADKAFKLMELPAPAGASGLVKGIRATTPPRVFEAGQHLIAVTAADAKGEESDRRVATVWVTIP